MEVDWISKSVALHLPRFLLDGPAEGGWKQSGGGFSIKESPASATDGIGILLLETGGELASTKGYSTSPLVRPPH